MIKLQNQNPTPVTYRDCWPIAARAVRPLNNMLLKAVLLLAASCTVANPHRRPDAGDEPDASDINDDSPDPRDSPGPGDSPGSSEKVGPVVCQPNLAYRATVTAKSFHEGWWPAQVVDGRTTSSPGFYGYSSQLGNNSNPNQTEWIEIDLGATRTVDSVVLYPRNDPGRVALGFPIDFTIKVWDGSQWLTRVTRTDYPKPDSSPQVFTWSTRDRASKIWIEATKLRTEDSGPWYVLQFAEVRVSDSMSESNPESNQLLGANVTASSTHEYEVAPYGWTTANVVDGDTTAAHAGYSSSLLIRSDPHTEWLEISTPCRKSLSKIVLYPRNQPGLVDNGFPEDFTISLWNGTSWDKKVEKTGYPLPGGAAQTFSWGSRYTTDKIRIDATKLRNLEKDGEGKGMYMFQLGEVEAYP